MVTDSQFRFEKETHSYFLQDVKLPSVTQVIAATIPRNYECADWYLQRGSAIHSAIHLLIQGKLDWDTVDERIEGRIRAYVRFMREFEGDAIITEAAMFSPKYQFAGTVDALVTSCGKFQKLQNGLVLMDIKSSLEQQIFIQLGGYRILCLESNQLLDAGLGLHVKEDGSYRCKWFTTWELQRASQTFLACLTVYNWMKQNGVLKE